MRRALSGTRTLWGAEWCQVGLDLSTTACPTLLPPSSPICTLSTPPHHHYHCCPLCSVGVTLLVAPQWHHRCLFMGELRGRDRGAGGALFTWRVLQSVHIFYWRAVPLWQTSVGVTKRYRDHFETFLNNVAIRILATHLLRRFEKVDLKKPTDSNTGHCGGFDLRWVTVAVVGAKRPGERSEKWSLFGSTPALLMLRRCSQRSQQRQQIPPIPLTPNHQCLFLTLSQTQCLFSMPHKRLVWGDRGLDMSRESNVAF